MWYVVGICGLIIVAVILWVAVQIRMITISEIANWYVRVDPNQMFHIPKRIQLLRNRVGEKTFRKILEMVDEKRV